MKHEGIAVGAENKGHVQRGRIVQRLLHPVARAVVVVLGLDQCNGKVLPVQNVVGPLGLAARDEFAPHDDAALGKENLAPKLHPLVPPSRDDRGGDEPGADIVLAQGFLVHVK